MATAKKLTDNYLTCAICTEVFTDPATLQCNHTFCKSCLLKYTKTQSEAIQAKSILCPSCRQQTKVTNPGSPVEEWVSQLKPSHVIQSLMDDFASECKDSNICSVCKENGEIIPASLWCSSCESGFCVRCIRVHRRNAMSQSHDVKNIATRVKSSSFICECHDEEVKMFCRDCDKAICHICCNVDHRSCKGIAVISDVLPEVKASLMTTKLDLEKEIAFKMDIIEKRKLQTKELSDRTEEVVAEIVVRSQTEVEKIRAKEKKLLEEVNKIKTSEIDKIQEDLKSRELSVKMREKHVHQIDNVLESNSKRRAFVLYQAGKSDSQTLKQLDITGVADNNFEVHLERFTGALNNVTLGSINSAQEETINYHTVRLSLHQRLNVKSNLDTTIPIVKDIVVMSVRGVNVVVVTDWTNKSIKEFYTLHDQPVQNMLKLEASPFGITEFGDNLVLVSLPWKRHLRVASVYPDLCVIKVIRTMRRYWGVSCMTCGVIAAGVCDGVSSCIDILNQKGAVITSVSNSFLQYPEYVHVTRSGKVLVSDNVTKSLLCLSHHGELLFKYILQGDTVVSVPRGVTSSHKGGVLLVDRDVHKVMLLTEAGEYVRDVLTSANGLDAPQGVFEDKDGCLYVTCKENIQVFK
ncbi:probable E3 ubiquitin-protein ligase MID2 [Haliotis rubra]|uniref:probable E3 ubiquitin-protein ligase MID2 n=1 Tax=Haliotis rubra TaxID=36100 RepID=UPI001EE5C16C|nr:probable E3 ubiquitin-protein ligase MID2 [Haliotis rubra]